MNLKQLITPKNEDGSVDHRYIPIAQSIVDLVGERVDALLEITPGYKHPEMHKAEERHQRICREHLNKCLDI